jgi:hypothetical protein
VNVFKKFILVILQKYSRYLMWFLWRNINFLKECIVMNFIAKKHIAFVVIITFVISLSYAEESSQKTSTSKQQFASTESKGILYHELQKIVIALCLPPKEILQSKKRDTYTTNCLNKWKKDIIELGDFYDKAVNNYDIIVSTEKSSLKFLPVPSLPRENIEFISSEARYGYEIAKGITDSWQREIYKEIQSNLNSMIESHKTKYTRDELLCNHPHVEALIYLSKQIKKNQENVDVCPCPNDVLSSPKQVSNTKTDEK